MRGLLWVVSLGIATLVVLVVIGVQVVVPAVVAAAVGGSPALAGQHVTVQVRTSLAGVLLGGRIDEVTVEGAGIQASSFDVGQLALTASDVTISTALPARLGGTLTDVTAFTLGGTKLYVGSVVISGAADQATLVASIDPSALEAALAAEVQSLGLGDFQIRVADGTIRITAGGREDVGTLRLEDQTLVFDPGAGQSPIPLLDSPPDGAWHLAGVSLSAAGARITAILDLARLGLRG
ncbi:MAG TPA: hypothetical protein VJ506_05160 [Candidatus Limnocylindrales bacterium]|nr:hypothetical protein [Candidatus Limnocylindrales bacterium]